MLNIRNGMVIAGITGNTQTGVIGLLLILSVLLPNIADGPGPATRRTAARVGPGAPPTAPPLTAQAGSARWSRRYRQGCGRVTSATLGERTGRHGRHRRQQEEEFA